MTERLEHALARELRRGGRVLAIAAMIVLGWAGLVPLSGAIVVTGNLVVQSSVKKVQHPSGGVVTRVLVRNGSRVAPLSATFFPTPSSTNRSHAWHMVHDQSVSGAISVPASPAAPWPLAPSTWERRATLRRAPARSIAKRRSAAAAIFTSTDFTGCVLGAGAPSRLHPNSVPPSNRMVTRSLMHGSI